MTDKEYAAKAAQDAFTVSACGRKFRSAMIRQVNDLLIKFRREYQLPRNTSPTIHWNAETERLEVSTMKEAAEHSNKQHGIATHKRKVLNYVFQEQYASLDKKLAVIYNLAQKYGFRVATKSRLGGASGTLILTAPNKQKFDSFVATLKKLK